MANIVKTDVVLPGEQNKLAFILENVYTKEECEQYIKITEKKGYEQALVNVGFGRQKLMTDYRNSSRCIWDSVKEANKMFQRIRPYLPDTWGKQQKVLSVNERLRFLRYDPGEYFKPHYDGSYTRDNGEISYLTVHLYLNEGYEGGCTTFINPRVRFLGGENEEVSKEDLVPVIPKTGSVLVFQHDIFHEGAMLISGRKYTVRSDVMFEPKPPRVIEPSQSK